MIMFTVPGRPMAKGNRRPFIVKGHAVMCEANPKSKVWENAVREAAAKARLGDALIDGPVRVSVTFQFARPRGHYGSGKNAAKLKDSAPHYHTQTPDTDKLLRAFGDGLTGVLLTDDRIVAHWSAWKVWGPCDETTATIEPMQNGATP